jgi:hypothetical protein
MVLIGMCPLAALLCRRAMWRKCSMAFQCGNQLCLAGNLFCTLLPYHNPNGIQQPDWVTQWFADEASGKDMATYYSP